jgi:hypothetical protein
MRDFKHAFWCNTLYLGRKLRILNGLAARNFSFKINTNEKDLEILSWLSGNQREMALSG